ncbi:hypothetical protein [Paenibacillus uliginis]|nr:hypothetical protein [Paenibacillus uliginis]
MNGKGVYSAIQQTVLQGVFFSVELTEWGKWSIGIGGENYTIKRVP